MYPLTLKEEEALDTFLQENLEKGFIRPLTLPQASPFFFVGKKDGTLWPIQDYRLLNKAIIKNTYPLLLVSNLLDQIKGYRFFIKLDLQNSYNNIWIKDRDQWKATFKTARGLYESMIIYFGLYNSLVTFQAFIDNVFYKQKQKGGLLIYMDNLLIIDQTITKLQE